MSGTSQGRIAIVVRSNERFATRASTNSTMPIGGWSSPIIRFSTTIRPKCTGSMPSLSTTGMSTGTAIRMAAVGSRKQPMKSSSRLTRSRNTHGVSVKAGTHSVTMSVTRVAVSSQPKIDAAATMNSTTAVVSMVSIETLVNMRNDSDRYQTMPRNSAQIDAATAASVGVKMPLAMPPMSSTGVMMGSTASNLKIQSATNSRKIATSVPTTGSTPSLAATNTANGKPMTMPSSSTALPTRGHSNRMSAPQLFLCAKYATVSIIRNDMTRPGTMPARNSCPIETFATMP